MVNVHNNLRGVEEDETMWNKSENVERIDDEVESKVQHTFNSTIKRKRYSIVTPREGEEVHEDIAHLEEIEYEKFAMLLEREQKKLMELVASIIKDFKTLGVEHNDLIE